MMISLIDEHRSVFGGQALHDRRPAHRGGLVYHSDRSSQYVSIRHSERLAEVRIETSVGSVGDTYDNALAENDQRSLQDRSHPSAGTAGFVAALEWGDWFNSRLLLEPIGNIPPAEAGEHYYARLARQSWPQKINEMASGKPGVVHTLLLQRVEWRLVALESGLSRIFDGRDAVLPAVEFQPGCNVRRYR